MGRTPKNLSALVDAFGKEAMEGLFGGESFHVEGVEFVCDYRPESTADRFFIVKPPPFVERFLELCRQYEGSRIFELGIAEGGSTALLALAAKPTKLVAVDLEAERLDALDDFRAARGLTEVVRPYYGVDQADRDHLVRILEKEFGDEPLDLVIDDASHQLAATRASFEVLFPRLRPGGLYAIEDWNAAHTFMAAVGRALREQARSGTSVLSDADPGAQARPELSSGERPPPLSTMVLELLLARAECLDDEPAVDALGIERWWVIVRRGGSELDPTTFRLRDLYNDHFGLVPRTG